MKTTLCFFAAVFFACLAPVFSQNTSPSADTLAARQMLETAQHLLDSAQFDSALDTTLLALRLNAGVSKSVDLEAANLLGNIGAKSYAANAFKQMQGSFSAAAEIWGRIKGENCPEYARSAHGTGVALIGMGKNKEALGFLLRGLAVRRDSIQEKTKADSISIARSYNMVGLALDNLGHYKEALENYERSIPIKRKVAGEQSLDMFTTYMNMAGLYSQMKRLQDLETYLVKSLNIALKLEKNEELLAKVYNGWGVLCVQRKDYGKAIDYHQLALAMRIKLHGEQSLPVAERYDNLAGAYMEQGDLLKALELYEKSWGIKQRQAEIDSFAVAKSYFNVGNVYGLMGKPKDLHKAMKYYRLSEPMLLAYHGGENHSDVGELRSSMASVFAQLEQPDSALAYYRKCLKTYTAISGPNSPDVQRTYNSIALVYQKVVKDIPTAVRYLDTVLAKVGWSEGRKVHPDDRFNLFEALLFKGEMLASVARAPAERAQARKLLAEALGLAEQYRDELERPDSKSYFMTLVRQVLESSIRLEMAEAGNNGQHLRRIYELASKNKAFLLFDAIRGVEALANVPDSLVKRENDLRRDISHYEKLRYEAERSTDPLDRQTAQNYDKQLFALQHEHDTLLRRFKERYPQFSKARYELDTADVPFVQDSLLAEGQSLLEYFVGDSAIYIFVIRKDTFAVVAVKNDFGLKTAVEGMLHGIYDHFKDKSKTGSRDDLVRTAKLYVDNAHLLYQKLVAPVEHLLNTTRIIIAPDEQLGYVPFDALLTARPRAVTLFALHPYWGKKHVISYTYSANLLYEMQHRQHKEPPAEVALVAAPFCDGAKQKVEKKSLPLSGGFAFTRDSLGILVYSGEEAQAVAQLLGCVPLLGEQADTASVLRHIRQCAVAHLSTHGVANFSAGEYSYLVFSVPGDSAAFVKLYVKDIYNLPLKAELVVLSACETGTGELRRGEGLISLARAFAYAGAKSITATLWSVDERRTHQVMVSYYKLLKEKGLYQKDEALWQARQDYLKECKKEGDSMEAQIEAHPFYWAAFVPIGDMQPLKLK